METKKTHSTTMQNHAKRTRQRRTFEEVSEDVANLNLEQLADAANGHHEDAIEAMRKTVLHAKFAGDALIAAKEKVPHKQFSQWLQKNFDASPETARVYMRVSREWDTVVVLLENNPDLTLEDVRHHLRRASPKDGKVQTPPVPEIQMRKGLQNNFKKWTEALPEAAVFALWDKWVFIWGEVIQFLCDHLGIEFDPDEGPVRPHAFDWGQRIPQGLSSDDDEEWDGNWDKRGEIAGQKTAAVKRHAAADPNWEPGHRDDGRPKRQAGKVASQKNRKSKRTKNATPNTTAANKPKQPRPENV